MGRETATELWNDRAWRGGPKVMKQDGRYVQVEEVAGADIELRPPQEYPCTHDGRLRGKRRCLGCGLTKAEIRVEEGR